MLRKVLWMALYGAIGAAGDDDRAPRRVGHLARRDRRAATREALMRGDKTVEKAADQLDTLADNAAAKGGVRGKVADELADDASFLRKLKPSLMVARAKGKRRRTQEPVTRAQAPAAPSRQPQLGPGRPARRGPNPFLVAGIAFAAGTLLAKAIDWRGHAHPRR